MQFKLKTFEQLSTSELYEILKARVNVFVVEQNCPYPELDDIDYESLHVLGEKDNKIVAYLRAHRKDEGIVRMGRVLTTERGKGYGAELLKKGIKEIKNHFDPQKIYIEAQTYAIGFYEREGFVVCSEEFLEDDIPHVKMELVL